jgi:integrase
MPTAKRRPKGSGRVRQLPSGRWQAQTRVGGRYVSAGGTFDTKLDASAWLRDANRQVEVGTFIAPDRAAPSSITLAQYVESWLPTHRSKRGPIRPRTAAHYRRLLDHYILPDLGALPLTKIQPATVRAWYDSLPEDRPTTRAHAYSLLATIMRKAWATNLVGTNPCRIEGASRVERVSETTIATDEQIRSIIDKMPDKYGAMILLATYCALRFGELTELRRDDIDLEDRVVRVRRAVVRVDGRFVVGRPKSKAGIRDVSIPPPIVPAIGRHLDRHVGAAPDALLFPAASGGHLNQSTLNTVFHPARQAAGRPDLRFHDLRHTGATKAAQAGGTLADLMGRLGHSSPGAALKYQHTAADRDRSLADAIGNMIEV